MLAVVHLLAIVILGIAIGIGLWQKKQWARILGIVFCIIVILESLIFLFANPLQWGLFMFLIGVAIILWLLAAYEPVKKLFKK